LGSEAPSATSARQQAPAGRCLNLYAGPGAGKTTAMASVFAELKHMRINAEMAVEYSKELVWHQMDFDQEKIFRVQARRMSVARHTDLVVSDGPFLQQLVYVEEEELQRRIIAEYAQYENIDVLLTRSDGMLYDPNGRYSDEATARVLDEEIEAMLKRLAVSFIRLQYSGRETTQHLLAILVDRGWIGSQVQLPLLKL
jgi:hypothetical protein